MSSMKLVIILVKIQSKMFYMVRNKHNKGRNE